MVRLMNNKFGKVTEIEVDNFETWEDKIFLTIDIDWAHDEVLEDTIDLVEKAEVAATWFVTHDTPLLERLCKNDNFELGIHPNFNFLLHGDPCKGANAEEVVNPLLEIVPEAKSVRSHSMTQSSGLLQLFQDKGLSHDCNHFIPEQAGMELKPWHLWNGLIKVPYFWEDDATCIYEQNAPVQELCHRGGVKVFDFHPIHVFLNTEHMDRYERTRSLHGSPEELAKHRFNRTGTRRWLEMILRSEAES